MGTTEHGIDLKIHALFCLFIYSITTFSPYLNRGSLIVLLFETSTIFLRLASVFKKRGYKTLMFVCRLSFTLTFFVFRIVIGSFVTFELWQVFFFGTLDV